MKLDEDRCIMLCSLRRNQIINTKDGNNLTEKKNQTVGPTGSQSISQNGEEFLPTQYLTSTLLTF